MAVRSKTIQTPLNLTASLQPKELELLRLMSRNDCSLIGYGGARGGAKSHGARSCAILRRLQFPGTRAMIFRRNYDDLWQQHIMMIAEEWPELFERYWSAENKALMLPGRSMVLFRYADTLKDVFKMRGKEYGDVFIDEATDLDETEIKVLYSCCRTTVDEVEVPDGRGGLVRRRFTPKKVLTFNPGGPGHGYVKRVFIDKQPTAEERVQNPQFIQAYAWDNVMWVRQALKDDGLTVREYRGWPQERQIEYLVGRSDYGKELNALPEALRKPWLYGDWDTFAGQMFDEFRRAVHVVRPFTIPGHWRRWVANDAGFSDPAAWGWYAANEQGRVFKYREMTFHRTPYSEQARAALRAMTTTDERGRERRETIDFYVTGMDSFVRDPETGKGPVDYYQEAGLGPWQQPDHGAGARARGAAVLHEYLKPMPRPDGEPGQLAQLAVFETCAEWIRTVPALVMDPNEPEAVLECSTDHWFDETRYGLQAWHARRSAAPRPAARPGSMAAVLRHDDVDKPRDAGGNLMRR